MIGRDSMSSCSHLMLKAVSCKSRAAQGLIQRGFKPSEGGVCPTSEQPVPSARPCVPRKIIKMVYFTVNSSRDQASYSKPDHS